VFPVRPCWLFHFYVCSSILLYAWSNFYSWWTDREKEKPPETEINKHLIINNLAIIVIHTTYNILLFTVFTTTCFDPYMIIFRSCHLILGILNHVSHFIIYTFHDDMFRSLYDHLQVVSSNLGYSQPCFAFYYLHFSRRHVSILYMIIFRSCNLILGILNHVSPLHILITLCMS
jgi:hypothetical protein